jgi:hypothetical protein
MNFEVLTEHFTTKSLNFEGAGNRNSDELLIAKA